jgi:ketosteroid isomerase-like protein
MNSQPHDLLAITSLVARFDDAVNRRDATEFATLWADDAVWEIGEPMPMHVQGAHNIIDTWRHMLGSTNWLFRGSFAGVVTVDGDVAFGRWPCIETGNFVDGKGYDNRALYEDRYVKHGGHWRFHHRRYLYLWLSNEPLPGAPVPLGAELGPPSGGA